MVRPTRTFTLLVLVCLAGIAFLACGSGHPSVSTSQAPPVSAALAPPIVSTAFPICRVGALSFPFDLCRERFEVHGLLAKVLAGDPSYAEP